MVCTEFECLSDRDSLYEIKGGSQYELRVSHAMCERMDLCNQIMQQTGAQVESVSARHPAYESGALDSVLHMAECITEWTSGAQALNPPGSVSCLPLSIFTPPISGIPFILQPMPVLCPCTYLYWHTAFPSLPSDYDASN